MTIGKDTTIYELKAEGLISYPTYYVLKDKDLLTIGELRAYIAEDQNQLDSLKHYGKRTFQEIEYIMSRSFDGNTIDKIAASEEREVCISVETNIGQLRDEGLITYPAYHFLNQLNLLSVDSILEYIGEPKYKFELSFCGNKPFGLIKGIFYSYIKRVHKKYKILKEVQRIKVKEKNGAGKQNVETCRIDDNTSIEYLAEEKLISARTYHVFKYYKILTIGDILSYIDGDVERLLRLRNFGRKSLLEVNKLLSNVSKETPDSEVFIKDDAPWLTDIFADAYKETFSEGDEVTTLIKNVFPTAESMLEAIGNDGHNFLTLYKEIGYEGNIRLRGLYLNFVERVIHGIDDMSYPHDTMYQKIASLRSTLTIFASQFSLDAEIEFFMSPAKKALIERSYYRRSLRLSARPLRLLQERMPTYREVVPYFGKEFYYYKDICPGQNMKKTLLDLYAFVSDFEKDVCAIRQLSEEDALRRDIGETIPFLGADQIEFVARYWEENQSYPMFFVLYFYLKNSDNRADYVFALLNGICDGEFHTLANVGEMLHLTRERVRQLSVKALPFQDSDLARHEDWGNYASLFRQPFITELSPKYRMTREDESLPFGFDIFSRLLPLAAPFRRFQVQGKNVLVNNELLSDWDFEHVLENIDNTFHERYARDTDFRLQDIMGEVTESLRDDVQGLMTYIISEAYGCQVAEDGSFTIEQNRIDVSQEIYDILFKNGRPMHLEEIFEAFKDLYPEHRYEDSRFLRPYIQKNSHIRGIGNTSTYALDSWDVYCGGVRDRLREILSQAAEPVFVDDIVRMVLEVVPYTNRASILASMDSADFVPYMQDRWGLANREYGSLFQRDMKGRQRKTFEVHFDEFREFVETYRRFPFNKGGEKEEALARWLHNVRNGSAATTDEQREKLETAIRTFQEMHYPENSSEYKCQEKCCEYREYMEENYELPTRQANEDLYMWMYKMKREYNGLSENNRHYLTELFNLINSYGFYL